MLRRLMLTMLLAAAVVPAIGTQAQAHHKKPCGIHWKNPDNGWEDTLADIRRLIRCAERRWSVPGDVEKALDVARCESGFNPYAIGGDNYGVYQHKLRYWRGRALEFWRDRWGPDPRKVGPLNGRVNVIVSMRMVHRAWSWAPWACA